MWLVKMLGLVLNLDIYCQITFQKDCINLHSSSNVRKTQKVVKCNNFFMYRVIPISQLNVYLTNFEIVFYLKCYKLFSQQESSFKSQPYLKYLLKLAKFLWYQSIFQVLNRRLFKYILFICYKLPVLNLTLNCP